ncbi:MAG TPA: FtsQ-type POTRA domain-containing protein [Ilumatobacter sp.]
MTTPRRPNGHEREPHRAALDELQRAFSDPEAPDDTSSSSSGDPADDDGGPTSPVASASTDALATLDAAGPVADGSAATAHDPDGVDPTPDMSDVPDVPDVPDMPDVPVVPVVPDVSDVSPRVVRIDDLAGSDDPDRRAAADPAPDAPSGAAPAVITIDDADLPDAVYVEGSLSPSSSKGIVIISDDDALDALTIESGRDSRRGIEPRLRERRIAVKRAAGRKRLGWIVAIASVVLVVVTALAVLGSSLFAIRADQVRVTGNVYTDPVMLQEVIDDLVGTPVLVADTQGAERRLEQIPWVDVARVRTNFPHGVTIEIRERAAMATYRGPDLRFRILDRDGRVLDVIENYAFAYVLLEGPDPVDLEPAEFAPRGYAAASELAKNLTGSVRGRVVSIEVTADGSRLVMHLDGDVDVRFGEARDLFQKLVRLETVLSSGDVPPGTTIDVSTSEVTL